MRSIQFWGFVRAATAFDWRVSFALRMIIGVLGLLAPGAAWALALVEI